MHIGEKPNKIAQWRKDKGKGHKNAKWRKAKQNALCRKAKAQRRKAHFIQSRSCSPSCSGNTHFIPFPEEHKKVELWYYSIQSDYLWGRPTRTMLLVSTVLVGPVLTDLRRVWSEAVWSLSSIGGASPLIGRSKPFIPRLKRMGTGESAHMSRDFGEAKEINTPTPQQNFIAVIFISLRDCWWI